MTNTKLKGVGVALITPFNEKKEVDYVAFEKVCNYIIDNGVNYLVVLGTTGETATLTKDEKQTLIHKTLEYANGKVPVVVGMGGNNTAEICKDLNEYDLTGIEAVLSVSPYYNKPTQEGIYEHYKTIANSTDLPVILYNVPGRTGSNIRATTTLQLANEVKNIIGIKEATNDWTQIFMLARDKPKDFLLISGNDDLIIPQLTLGFDGVISVIANATPKLFSTIVQHGMNNDFAAARPIVFQLDELITHIFEQGNPAGVKCAMQHLGLCRDDVRLPLMPVNYDLRKKIGAKIATLGKDFELLINGNLKQN